MIIYHAKNFYSEGMPMAQKNKKMTSKRLIYLSTSHSALLYTRQVWGPDGTVIEAEQEMVNANKKLIEIFEQKIKDKIGEVWGEEPTTWVKSDKKPSTKGKILWPDLT